MDSVFVKLTFIAVLSLNGLPFYLPTHYLLAFPLSDVLSEVQRVDQHVKQLEGMHGRVSGELGAQQELMKALADALRQVRAWGRWGCQSLDPY